MNGRFVKRTQRIQKAQWLSARCSVRAARSALESKLGGALRGRASVWSAAGESDGTAALLTVCVSKSAASGSLRVLRLPAHPRVADQGTRMKHFKPLPFRPRCAGLSVLGLDPFARMLTIFCQDKPFCCNAPVVREPKVYDGRAYVFSGANRTGPTPKPLIHLAPNSGLASSRRWSKQRGWD